MIPTQELKQLRAFHKEQKCRICGCTDLKACKEGCEWVEGDLCSKCVKSS